VVGAIGLNLLTGFTGRFPLGMGHFMQSGVYRCYPVGALWHAVLGGPHRRWRYGGSSGTFFGMPSLRIKGLYLAIAYPRCPVYH